MSTIMAPPREIAARGLVRPLSLVIGLGLLFLVIMRGAVRAWLPTSAVALLAPASAVALVAAVFQAGVTLGPLARDERGQPRPLLRRHGFWVVALAIATSLPLLGAFSLTDPWETHYAEVAREMIERHDFVSPWWANEGWFMSKPVLTFWLEAISMKVFGVHTGPDQVLLGGAHPEWAVRFPAFALAVVGAYLLYQGVARTAGRRAGLIGAVVLLTMPGYALLSHQAITDMPLVASVAASVGFLLRAFATNGEAHVPRFTVRLGARALTLHAGHLLAGAIFVLVAPQLLVLLSNHVHGLTIGVDRLFAGSPHACGMPSQPACAPVALAHPRLQPIVQVLVWLPVLVWLVVQVGSETRASRLFAIAAWTAAAFGAMAKGPAAFVVPAAAGLLALAATREWRTVMRLEILAGLGVSVLLIAPWYLAVYARHGRSFTDTLVLHHMLGRTLDHLHDTNTGDDVGLAYFVKQLGYATFPWAGLALAAMVSGGHASRRGAARTLLFGAALAAFTLVSSMGTKFHHYGLICLPPVAMLVGQWLDERIGERRRRARDAWALVMLVAAALVTLLVARDLTGTGTTRFVQLMTYRYDRHWVHTTPFAPLLVGFGVSMAIATVATAKYRKLGVAALGIVGVGFSVMLLDVYLVRTAGDGGQRAVFDAYYSGRTDNEPLVAYQLNWKGENFYSGNDIALFISSGAPMHTYLEKRKAQGTNTVFFVTERGRINGLKSELGAVRSFQESTLAESSPEFALLRVDL